MSVKTKIVGALETQLATLETGIAIAYENDANFTPQRGVPYLRSWHIPGNSIVSSIGINGIIRHQGIFQVDCCYEIGTGFGPAYAKVDQILALFKKGTALVNNGQRVVITISNAGTGSSEDGWYRIPVSIEYFSFEVM